MSPLPINRVPVRRALVSVYDKTGLDDLVRGLHDAGVALVSTGGSAARIESLGIPVTKVEDLTGFPECLDGRVKTLHPKVHAGILADRRLESHVQQLAELGVEPFDLVVSNLYPFRQTVASGASPDECVEQIDIGGPSMVRAAAKNHPSVAIVTSPVVVRRRAGRRGRGRVHPRAAPAAGRRGLRPHRGVRRRRRGLDGLGAGSAGGRVLLPGVRRRDVHQGRRPEVRREPAPAGRAVRRRLRRAGLGAEQLFGKEMSYNNYVDTDAARRAAWDFAEPAVAIIKHANPCGIAVGADIAEAHRLANECDPISAFGGVIAANRPVSVAMAEQVAEVFTEVIVAPAYEDGAVEVLQARKNLRILVCGGPEEESGFEFRMVSGGVLQQQVDHVDAPGDDPATWTLAAGPAADEATLADLAFAWKACRAVKSNAILLADAGRVRRHRHGPGQPRRLVPPRRLPRR